MIKLSKNHLKKVISSALVCTMTATMLQCFPDNRFLVNAEETNQKYPYTMFAASSNEGAITVNANNFCVNGNVATNGTIVSSGNTNINGTRTEQAAEEMLYIFDKIDSKYFTGSNVEEYTEDYTLEEMNININNPVEVEGDATLTGNININSALKALENVELYGEVKNTNESLIYSKYGDIIIESQNVNLNGLVYAPFGDVVVTAQNLNLNNVVIIANSITLSCPNVNANYSNNVGLFVGNESEDFSAPYDEWFYLDDSDTDGLPDLIENIIGSDPMLFDTDNDSLTDGYEYRITITNLNENDSDGNGITDDAEDFDNDGFNNFEEYSHKTSPFNKDTDGDNLLDSDEVNKYHTNPLKFDTDDDGLNDDDEIEINLNPNIPDSDGDGILDGDEVTEQKVSKEVKSHDDTISKITVEMNTSGILEKNITIESVYDIDLLATETVGLIGDPFEIEVSTPFETADITFTLDQYKLINTSFDDLCVLWYDEENQRLVECTPENNFITKMNKSNSQITVTTTHFSKYMIVNKIEWYKVWENSFNKINTAIKRTDVDSQNINSNTVFVIDTSGSMATYDPISRKLRDDAPPRPPITDDNMEEYWLEHYGCNTCKRITACENFIQCMKDDDKASIITFSNKNNTITQCGLTSSKTDLLDSLQEIKDYGGTYYSTALNLAINELINNGQIGNSVIINRIIFLSDGEPDSEDAIATNNAAAKALKNKIKIYTFGLGHYSGDVFLTELAHKTNGEFYEVIDADDLSDAIEKSDIEAIKNNPDFDLLWKIDSDNDNIPDIVEMYGLRPNGKPLATDIFSPDSDGDGISDGEEIFIDKEEFENGIYNGNIKNGISTPSDPTATTVNAPYGQIKYAGEYYKIAVPALQRIRNEYYYEPVYKVYDRFSASDVDFSIVEYIAGKELSATDDLHDASQPITGGYTFTKKNGYLKNKTFRNENKYNLSAGGVLIFSMITDMLSNSFSRKDIHFTFYKSKDNSARKVVLTASSTDVQQMYEQYSGFEHSGFIERSGYVLDQVFFSSSCKELYEEITGSTVDDTLYYYDLVVNVDERHRGSSAFANLWINDEGNIMATPIIYDKDTAKLVRRNKFTYLFTYETLLNLPLSETINLEQSYVDLFKKAYEKNN